MEGLFSSIGESSWCFQQKKVALKRCGRLFFHPPHADLSSPNLMLILFSACWLKMVALL